MHCAAQRYSITSSAQASSAGGTLRPSALAVLRLMTKFEPGRQFTGRSPGLVPSTFCPLPNRQLHKHQPAGPRDARVGRHNLLIVHVTSEAASRFAGLLSLPVSAGLICRIALVRKLNSANGRAATSTVSVRTMAAQRGSISDFAEPVELLSCSGSCSCTCAGSCTCAPHLTSLVPSCAPHLTSLMPSCAPLLTPLHASGLSLSIGYCQYRRGRREAERGRQSHQ